MTDQLTSPFSFSTHTPDAPVSPETDALRRRIQKLPRKTQQVFLLSRLDKLPYADIAHVIEQDVECVERCMVRLMDQCSDTPSLFHAKARRWYVHLQSPLATASQRIEFRHWLDADALHLSAFQDAEQLWRRLQAPATLMGASGWHRRKRRLYVGWVLLTAFLCSLLMTAEAFT